jgi:transposase
MASPYSNDLRRKLLEAHQRGQGSLPELAQRFDVSLGWAKKISAVLRATGKMERPPGRPRGPASKVTAEVEEDLQKWIRKQPDLTLAELQNQLWSQRKLEISVGRLWAALRQMGLRLKKSRSTPRNKTPQPANSGVVSGAKRRTNSIRRG